MNVQNTLIQMQNDTAKIQHAEGQRNVGTGKLGKDAFLQLLLAQLQHQDPMNPLEDSEFISQQAQFTQIEKLDQLIDTMGLSNQISQAGSLVGQTVELALENGQTRTGRVDSVKFGTDGVGLMVGDSVYSMGQVIQIFANGP